MTTNNIPKPEQETIATFANDTTVISIEKDHKIDDKNYKSRLTK